MLCKSDWAHLIPHGGSMCLLDTVVDWDAQTLHAVSAGHRDPENPLRREGRLGAVHLAEYGAQATAIHGALHAHESGVQTPRPGLLVALRDLRLACEYIDDLPGDLDVRVECLYADDAGTQYRFHIEHRDMQMAAGRVAVMYA